MQYFALLISTERERTPEEGCAETEAYRAFGAKDRTVLVKARERSGEREQIGAESIRGESRERGPEMIGEAQQRQRKLAFVRVAEQNLRPGIG